MADNPLKSDEKLKALLQDVGSIQSGEAFSDWKASFLKVYKSYLDPDGILNARDADGRLIKKLQGLAKISLKVQALSETGHISKAQVSADGRRALGKWTEEMAIVEKEVAKFCPKTTKEIDTVGYDKFELGAILIRDGFQAYEIMLTNRDFIQELRDGPLNGVLDKNQLSIMDFYAREMQLFVDVMSDLGLMKLMNKCVEVYQEEDRPNISKEVDILMEPDKEEVVVQETNGKGPDSFGAQSRGNKTKKSDKAGSVGKSATSGEKGKNGDDDQYVLPPPEDEDNEEPPPEEGDGGEGEKIIYFDPKTNSIGLMMREKCTTNELMFVQGDLKNVGVIEDKEEKDSVIWLLKKLEKKKPKEGEWLEKIKKEKAKKGKEGGLKSGRVKKEPTAGSPTKPKPKRPVRRLSSTKEVKQQSSGFKNPLEQGSGTKKTGRKNVVQDYEGMYKKAAPKPADSGWNKVAP